MGCTCFHQLVSTNVGSTNVDSTVVSTTCLISRGMRKVTIARIWIMKGRDTRKGIKNNEDNGGRDIMRKMIQNKKDIFTSAEWTFNASQLRLIQTILLTSFTLNTPLT